MQVIEQDPTPPRALRPSLDRDLEMIVIRCLQKPIDLRYESADALADDLEAYLADEKVSASSGRFHQVIARVFRETHHAAILENWGTLWIWHSMVLAGRRPLDLATESSRRDAALGLRGGMDSRAGHLGGRFLETAPANGTGHLHRASGCPCLGRQHDRDRHAVSDRVVARPAGADVFAAAGRDQWDGLHHQGGHASRRVLHPGRRLAHAAVMMALMPEHAAPALWHRRPQPASSFRDSSTLGGDSQDEPFDRSDGVTPVFIVHAV